MANPSQGWLRGDDRRTDPPVFRALVSLLTVTLIAGVAIAASSRGQRQHLPADGPAGSKANRHDAPKEARTGLDVSVPKAGIGNSPGLPARLAVAMECGLNARELLDAGYAVAELSTPQEIHFKNPHRENCEPLYRRTASVKGPLIFPPSTARTGHARPGMRVPFARGTESACGRSRAEWI